MTATRDLKHTRTPVRLHAVWVTIIRVFLFRGSEAQEVECNHYYVSTPPVLPEEATSAVAAQITRSIP
jgi:hypothetical protein